METVTQPNGILHTLEGGRLLTTAQHGNYMQLYEAIYLALTQQAPNPIPADEVISVIELIAQQQTCTANHIYLSKKLS